MNNNNNMKDAVRWICLAAMTITAIIVTKSIEPLFFCLLIALIM